MKFAATLVESLSAVARPVSLEPGDVLVEEGDDADDVFYILSGTIEATNATPYGDVVVGTIGAGQVIGEVTVIAGGRRTATLRAQSPAEVLVIHRSDFEAWLADNPEIADAVSAQARERIDRTHVAAMVTELIGADDNSLVQEVVDRVEWRRLEAGDVLFEQGDASDAAYFIVGGRVRVLIRNEDGTEEAVSELGRGEVVGELGLLDEAPRSATVRAVRDTTLARFPTETFEELVMRAPGLMLHVARGILTRLRRTPRRLIGRAASLTIAVTAPIDAGPLVAGIVAEIARFGTVRHLSSGRVDELLNRPNIAQAAHDNVGVPRLAEFMHEADVGNDHVVLQADPVDADGELTAWTRRAVRQADRVLIVASPRPDGTERAAIRRLLAEVADTDHVQRMLAFVHPPGTDRPRSTAALVRDFGADEVVHLHAGSSADVARLARLASGNGIGLVLSGGGARGFAHIGVYFALRDAGVPIDYVAGCSMGAPIAGGLALDVPDDEKIDRAEQMFRRLLDYTVPIVSLIKGERITSNIEQAFGDWDIEDLWLPFYCVSTNLTRSRLEVHRRGSAAKAIRASVAIPGVLPPVPHEGDLLVDGGVLNNLPFETMRADGMIDTVIAVDVAPEQGPRAKADYGMSVSGFKALAATVRRSPNVYPSVSSVLLRSMLTGAVRNQQTAMRDGTIDLLLRLHLPGIGLLEFDRVAEVSQAGYDASIDKIREWASTRAWLGAPA